MNSNILQTKVFTDCPRCFSHNTNGARACANPECQLLVYENGEYSFFVGEHYFIDVEGDQTEISDDDMETIVTLNYRIPITITQDEFDKILLLL